MADEYAAPLFHIVVPPKATTRLISLMRRRSDAQGDRETRPAGPRAQQVNIEPELFRDPAFLRAASILVGPDVDVADMPDGPTKSEFLHLAILGLDDKLNSLQRARLEFLTQQMLARWQFLKEHHLLNSERAGTERARDRKAYWQRKLRQKTRRGQPILRNVARHQYEIVRDMIAREG